jgi:8-oxo-dGTP diphosphatase
MSERHQISQGVAVVIRRESDNNTSEILLALRAKHLRYMGGFWSLPVGHVEALESPSQAMSREMQEELGVRVASTALKPILTVHTPPEPGEGPEGQRTDTYFEALISDVNGPIENREPERCDAVQWFPENALPDNFMPRQATALKHIQQGRTYVEEGWA